MCFLIVDIHDSETFTIPVDGVRVKSYLEGFLDPPAVLLGVSLRRSKAHDGRRSHGLAQKRRRFA